MFVSALNNKVNFNANLPIYHVFRYDKDGNHTEIQDRNIAGIAQALTKRLNNPTTREHIFFMNLGIFADEFKIKPIATSTSSMTQRGCNAYIVYGEDVNTINGLRSDCYQKGKLREDELFSYIFKWLINQPTKRAKNPITKEELGLVLYADAKGEKKNHLNGFKIITKSGMTIAELPPVYKTKTQKINIEEAEIAEGLEEYYKYKEEENKIAASISQNEPPKKVQYIQGELFGDEVYSSSSDKEDYVQRRANLPQLRTNQKKKLTKWK